MTVFLIRLFATEILVLFVLVCIVEATGPYEVPEHVWAKRALGLMGIITALTLITLIWSFPT